MHVSHPPSAQDTPERLMRPLTSGTMHAAICDEIRAIDEPGEDFGYVVLVVYGFDNLKNITFVGSSQPGRRPTRALSAAYAPALSLLEAAADSPQGKCRRLLVPARSQR